MTFLKSPDSLTHPVCCIISRGQRTRGNIPFCSLGKMLTTPHCKSVPDYEIFHKVSDELAGSCECGDEISRFINTGNIMSS
jgi:hypothetical protein